MKTFNKIWIVAALVSSVALVPYNVYVNDNSEAFAWFIISLANLSSLIETFGLKPSISVELEKKEVE